MIDDPAGQRKVLPGTSHNMTGLLLFLAFVFLNICLQTNHPGNSNLHRVGEVNRNTDSHGGTAWHLFCAPLPLRACTGTVLFNQSTSSIVLSAGNERGTGLDIGLYKVVEDH